MKRNSRRAGISLVALVITIIVLIILTGAVIVTFMEGGIIDRAKESVFKNDMRIYQEILALKRAENQMEIALGEKEDVEINASTLAEIQEIIPEFKEEYEGIVVITDGELSIGERVSGEELSSSEELYATWLSDLGIGLSRLPKNALASYVEVGDYVAYSPEENNVTSYELLGTESGYYTNSTTKEFVNQTITRQSINWRVLKNDGRQVTLISETPIDSIGLGGSKGFLNGPSLLDDIYDTLYSGNKGIARNLKMEDVNEAMKVEIGMDVKPAYVNQEGIIVPMGAKATYGDAMKQSEYTITEEKMPDENYRDYELDYYYAGSIYKERNEMAYKLIYRDVADSTYVNVYWLSSSCIYVDFSVNYAYFLVRCVDSGEMNACGVYESFGDMYCSDGICGRPIVILNSDVEVANPTAGGDTVATAWKLK